MTPESSYDGMIRLSACVALSSCLKASRVERNDVPSRPHARRLTYQYVMETIIGLCLTRPSDLRGVVDALERYWLANQSLLHISVQLFLG